MTYDKVDLFQKYKQTGDITIRNEIVLRHMETLRLSAVSLRNMYARGYDVDDLINEGVIALIASVEAFEPGRGIKFETFAGYKIKGAIIDYIRRQDWVPRRVRRFGREMNDAYGELYRQQGRNPTNSELAAYMGISPEQFEKRLADTVSANTLSFEELLYQDNLELAADGEEHQVGSRVLQEEQTKVVAEAIAELRPKEQQVVALYYYENLKLREIAEVIGVTESRVCQIHSKCMLLLKEKLQNYMNNN
ncbi:MAG: FliA/WhiG family RNA polymerase sigma factor [Oscillospiraceae bacterium]|nr:FliA/WhiG family RNA polymerase sigma factor [Oscillospiraceae bacterium]